MTNVAQRETAPAIVPSSSPYMPKVDQEARLRVIRDLVDALPASTRQRLLWEIARAVETNLPDSRRLGWAIDATRSAVENARWFT